MRAHLLKSFLGGCGELPFDCSNEEIATPHAAGAKEATTGMGPPVVATLPQRKTASARPVPTPAGRAETSTCVEPARLGQVDPAPAIVPLAGAGNFSADRPGDDDGKVAIGLRITPQMLVLIKAVAAHDGVSLAQAIVGACAFRADHIGLGPLARAVLDERERKRLGINRSHNGADDLTDVPEFARPNNSRFKAGDR